MRQQAHAPHLLYLLLPVLSQQVAVVVVDLLVCRLLHHAQAQVLAAVDGAQRASHHQPCGDSEQERAGERGEHKQATQPQQDAHQHARCFWGAVWGATGGVMLVREQQPQKPGVLRNM